MLNGLKAFLVSFFFGASVNAASDPVKILFIGNSYTHMNEMPKILQKITDKEGKDAIIERSTLSGASFKDHAGRADMYEAIKKRNWDYVVLQGYSRELSFPKEHIDSATVPYVNQIIDSIYANNACTNVLFYMTWGYDNGFLDREEVNSYEKMADSIERGYTYLGQVYQVPVVPVGMVWKNVRQNSDIDLYAPDRAHPSKMGSYLIATTFFNAIFGESSGGDSTTSLSSENSERIKKEAHLFVEANREKYGFINEPFGLTTSVTNKGGYLLEFMSSFTDSAKVTWFFGDGEKSQEKQGTYLYKKPGDYIVKLSVEEECGVKTYRQEIKFSKSEQPRRRRRRERKRPKYDAKNEKKD